MKDDGDENKKAKDTKESVIKRKHKFEDYKNCLEEIELENNINQLKKNLMWIILEKIIKNSLKTIE